jgi:ATP-dependent Zn protease
MKKLYLILFIIFTSFASNIVLSDDTNEISYSQFIQNVKQGNVASVNVLGSNISGVTKSGEKFDTYSPGDLDLMGVLLNNGVSVEVGPPPKDSFILLFFSSFGPLIVIILIIISIIVSRRKNRIKNKDLLHKKSEEITKNGIVFNPANMTEQYSVKKCPTCTEEINKDATKCKHCGERVGKGYEIIADGTYVANKIQGEWISGQTSENKQSGNLFFRVIWITLTVLIIILLFNTAVLTAFFGAIF